MNNELEKLVRINKSQVEPAVEALTKAFKETPSMKYYLPNDAKKEKAVRCFLSIGVHAGIKYGEVYATSSNYEGAAIWVSSDSLPISTWKMLSSVSLLSVLGFIRYGGLKMMSIGEYVEKAHKRLAPAKHWYLQTIGVEPKFQGKGYSGRLIRPMLAKIDSQHLPCYLETFEEKNASIYEHFGFKVIERASIPQTSFENWAMLRDAH
ncbi:MAG: GNAT family N-acetyltransferase [Candidatus Bathyarchaeota archaeon]|nr:GNAT family N-acetyltransferase [Candidatus Bathyarchaeota archaeon]